MAKGVPGILTRYIPTELLVETATFEQQHRLRSCLVALQPHCILEYGALKISSAWRKRLTDYQPSISGLTRGVTVAFRLNKCKLDGVALPRLPCQDLAAESQGRGYQ